MTVAKARVIFATHMQAARARKLTKYEIDQLSKARQTLRQSRKPNPERKQTIKAEHADVFIHNISAKKAREMLHRGEYSSEQQRRFLGARASGYPQKMNPRKRAPWMPSDKVTRVAKRLQHFGYSKKEALHYAKAVDESTGIVDVDETVEKIVRQHAHKSVGGQRNPKHVLIYGNVTRVYAQKTQDHICDDDCKKHGHRYYHEFSSKPKMYGLPNGDLLITTR